MGYGCGCRNQLIYHCGGSLSGNPPGNDHPGLRWWWPLAQSGLCVTCDRPVLRPRPLSMGCAAPELPPLHCSKQFQLREVICIPSSPVSLFVSTITSLFYSLFFIFHIDFSCTFYFIFYASEIVADKLGLHASIFAITFPGNVGVI